MILICFNDYKFLRCVHYLDNKVNDDLINPKEFAVNGWLQQGSC